MRLSKRFAQLSLLVLLLTIAAVLTGPAAPAAGAYWLHRRRHGR